MTTKTINIASALDSARFTIREMESLIQSCHNQFELVFDDVIWRKHQPSSWLAEAYARLLCAQNYVAAIDVSDQSEANQHRAARAGWLCYALEGAVKALLSRAYVELARKQPACKKYTALAEQALSYSQVTLGFNWEYFIPELLIWEDRELPEQQTRYVFMLLNYGDVALSYALTLTAQLRALEHHPNRAKLIVVPEVIKIKRLPGQDYFFGKSTAPAPYALPRVPSFLENRERFTTRQQVENTWGCLVHEEAREEHVIGMGGKWSQDLKYGQPKDRLAGFQRRRGGSGSRQRRLARRAQSTTVAVA